MTLVLPSGTVFDTSEVDAERRFAEAEPELAQGLLDLRNELLADEELVERIRRKFRIRNTTGYRLCALLDAETPLEIFRRLVVGSEGTLAFIAEVVMETMTNPEHTTVSWLHFPSIDAAARVVPDLVSLGATAVEMMLAPALAAAAELMAGTPSHWKELPVESAALLVEFGGDLQALDRAEAVTAQLLAQHELLVPPAFRRDDEVIELAWGFGRACSGYLANSARRYGSDRGGRLLRPRTGWRFCPRHQRPPRGSRLQPGRFRPCRLRKPSLPPYSGAW